MQPAEDTLLPVGRIIKSYGTEGEVMAAFQEGIADLLKKDEPVWLFYDGLPVPFYIIGYPELSDTDAHTITKDGLTLEDLIGFSLLDQEGSTAGTIADILDFSGNICLELSGSGALVPFHDDLLINLDPELRTVTLHIDENLLQ